MFIIESDLPLYSNYACDPHGYGPDGNPDDESEDFENPCGDCVRN